VTIGDGGLVPAVVGCTVVDGQVGALVGPVRVEEIFQKLSFDSDHLDAHQFYQFQRDSWRLRANRKPLHFDSNASLKGTADLQLCH